MEQTNDQTECVKIPRIHHATDRRCYQGAYCSDMEREINSKNGARSALSNVGMSITYFPAGSFYVGFEQRPERAPKIITDDCPSFDRCVSECAEYLRSKGMNVVEE